MSRSLARDATLTFELEPLAPFLEDPAATEICVNGPGAAFVLAGGLWREEPCPGLTSGRLSDLANAAAVYAGRPFGSLSPLLSMTLPGGERAQFAGPPAAPEGRLYVSIRRPADRVRTVDEFLREGFFDAPEPLSREDPGELGRLFSRAEAGGPGAPAARAQFLKLAVALQKNIVIAGETGSGKTTFMKALMQEIPASERILTIEDVPELRAGLPRHRNQVNLFYPPEARDGDPLSAGRLLRAALRMKPDRILIAELRGAETYEFLNACLTGHGGSITSCHAGGCEEALEYLLLKVLQSEAGSRLTEPAIRRLIGLTVDVIVHVSARGPRRRADEIWYRNAPGGEGNSKQGASI
ncbi:P-type DNA transfer ATPase VirB11 [Mesosutterella sp. AGMB02718]|uniref:Type IV secretion system protein n=1 Tax=Mesosutterella faecium TaxID=2925194 RepID=A0ABT7INS4_9BURK|nr:P-type DNA transfer ATPase VirB11 [Mesosutterella sp. AGMB02718]MDL2060040.1 P-type DNA transfer ATPase VirB11 [Mesosutterella sp. AGMB02718]